MHAFHFSATAKRHLPGSTCDSCHVLAPVAASLWPFTPHHPPATLPWRHADGSLYLFPASPFLSCVLLLERRQDLEHTGGKWERSDLHTLIKLLYHELAFFGYTGMETKVRLWFRVWSVIPGNWQEWNRPGRLACLTTLMQLCVARPKGDHLAPQSFVDWPLSQVSGAFPVGCLPDRCAGKDESPAHGWMIASHPWNSFSYLKCCIIWGWREHWIGNPGHADFVRTSLRILRWAPYTLMPEITHEG